MPFDAMIVPADSQNQAVPVPVADTPIYTVLQNGQFTILETEDTPCYTLTAAAIEELRS